MPSTNYRSRSLTRTSKQQQNRAQSPDTFPVHPATVRLSFLRLQRNRSKHQLIATTAQVDGVRRLQRNGPHQQLIATTRQLDGALAPIQIPLTMGIGVGSQLVVTLIR